MLGTLTGFAGCLPGVVMGCVIASIAMAEVDAFRGGQIPNCGKRIRADFYLCIDMPTQAKGEADSFDLRTRRRSAAPKNLGCERLASTICHCDSRNAIGHVLVAGGIGPKDQRLTRHWPTVPAPYDFT